MDNEIQLISDGDGVAIIGAETAVEAFLKSKGLLASSRQLNLRRLEALLAMASDATQAASEIAENSGRWIRLTEESARLVKDHGLIETKTPGVSHVMVGIPGKVQNWLQTEQRLGSLVTNPAVLSGVAGLMAQVASREAMAEITDYLAKIDEKLDDVRRAQKNQVLARTDGVDLAIREAMSVRESVGRVSEITWSKVESTSTTILETQAYASRQLRDLAEKLERKSKVGDIAKTAKEAGSEVRVWLAVLARCFQLQDAIADLELDRVSDASPDELDRHRLGLKAARQSRLELFLERTAQLLDRMDVAVGKANAKLVWNWKKSLEVVQAGNLVASGVDDFHELLEIQAEPRSWSARQLGPIVEKGAQAIQGTKDATPYAAAVVGLVGLAAAGKKAQDRGEA
ncbi:hypothetical protein [Trujillonella humicola]|uniref:hypothetical protein n=1 Tax=Trujillonella humicola TaxID=3383699 RepID=UPI0039058B91